MRAMTFILVIIVSILFIAFGLGAFWICNLYFGWSLDVFEKHTGFFQAWIYILQTFALVATLIYIGLQTRAAQRAATVNTVQLMVTAHRELLNRMADQPRLLDDISGDALPEDKSSTVYMSMLFNHGLNTFSLRREGYINKDWWKAIVRDMRDVFRKGAMRQWWHHIKEYYPERYRKFIDNKVLND